MIDNEIIKALEKAISHHETVANKEWSLTLSKETTIALLDLIKRNDDTINGLIAGQETLQKHLAEKNAEIERLQHKNTELQHEILSCKTKAIKEFAERLKNLTASYWLDNVNVGHINDLVKEMVGE